MDDRFRVNGVDLGVDLRRSVATLAADGRLDARVFAGAVPGAVAGWATVAPQFLLARVPVRFDDAGFGATIDPAFVDDLELDDGEAVFALSSRFDLDGRLTVHAGDRLRFVGDVQTPWSEAPWRLDVSLAFGGRRRAAV